jgi:hypothetical protein
MPRLWAGRCEQVSIPRFCMKQRLNTKPAPPRKEAGKGRRLPRKQTKLSSVWDDGEIPSSFRAAAGNSNVSRKFEGTTKNSQPVTRTRPFGGTIDVIQKESFFCEQNLQLTSLNRCARRVARVGRWKEKPWRGASFIQLRSSTVRI